MAATAVPPRVALVPALDRRLGGTGVACSAPSTRSDSAALLAMPPSGSETLFLGGGGGGVASCGCGCRHGGWPLPQPPPSPPPMTAEECDMAEESDDDPVRQRRAEIEAMAAGEYDALEEHCLNALRRLPNVTTVNAFDRGGGGANRGVRVSLNCTGDCKKKDRPQQRCNAQISTRAHAAEILLSVVTNEHAECIRDRMRWCQGEPSAAPTAFTHIAEAKRKASAVEAASTRVKSCHQDVITAKAVVQAAQERELQAVKEREEAEAALAELKASVRQGKSARTEDQQDTSTLDVDDDAEVEATDPEAWESYTLPTFRALFKKYRTSSSKKIDPSNTDKELPAKGDDDGRRGWRNHKIRGMYGAVRHWASGSPFRVAFMLAELVIYFGVQDAVRAVMRRNAL